jgi:hypothetical protein
MVLPVSAMDFQAPDAPDTAQKYIDEETESFSEGLWYIIRSTLSSIKPEIQEACKSSMLLVSIVLLSSMSSNIVKLGSFINNLVVTLAVSCVLIGQPIPTYH